MDTADPPATGEKTKEETGLVEAKQGDAPTQSPSKSPAKDDKRHKEGGGKGPTAEKPQVKLPPAESIFKLLATSPTAASSSSSSSSERCGQLLGELATPRFVMLTSRGVPQHWRPVLSGGAKELYELPVGDLLLRSDVVSDCPESAKGCKGLWPHLEEQWTYCSFRNPLRSISVYGGDAVCSVETFAGRRKVSAKDLLSLQKIMKADLVAVPGEEVGLDVTTARRTNRAVTRADEWLKEILEAKAQDPDLSSFQWHVIASIQGGADPKLRQKAAANAASAPVAGCWIGGLGYSESLSCRAGILQAVVSSLPVEMPRFLPLNSGSPIEVLHAVMHGIDVLEVPYPLQLATQGIALTFKWEMPSSEVASCVAEKDGSEEDELEKALQSASAGDGQVVAKQLVLRSSECRENFGPICETSPVQQYSQAYLCHLFEVHELLGTMLVAQHNQHAYEQFFRAIRSHIQDGSFRRYVLWFLQMQTQKPSVEPGSSTAPYPKRRKI